LLERDFTVSGCSMLKVKKIEILSKFGTGPVHKVIWSQSHW
jgi:hypothetical protein